MRHWLSEHLDEALIGDSIGTLLVLVWIGFVIWFMVMGDPAPTSLDCSGSAC